MSRSPSSMPPLQPPFQQPAADDTPRGETGVIAAIFKDHIRPLLTTKPLQTFDINLKPHHSGILHGAVYNGTVFITYAGALPDDDRLCQKDYIAQGFKLNQDEITFAETPASHKKFNKDYTASNKVPESFLSNLQVFHRVLKDKNHQAQITLLDSL